MADRQEHLKTPDSYRDTAVPTHRSVAAIEHILREFGAEATGVQTVRQGDSAATEVKFAYAGRVYRIRVQLGDEPRDHRQRFRVLYWFIKAILEAVAFGVVTAEDALLPYLELAGGRGTVADALRGGELPGLGPGEVFGIVTKALPARAGQGRA